MRCCVSGIKKEQSKQDPGLLDWTEGRERVASQLCRVMLRADQEGAVGCCWPVLLALHLFQDRIMDAWMSGRPGSGQGRGAGQHPTTGHLLIILFSPSSLSTNPVVEIIRFLTRGCDFCESLHQLEAINATPLDPGSSSSGAVSAIWQRRCGRGKSCWQDEGSMARTTAPVLDWTGQPQQDSRILKSHRHDSRMELNSRQQPRAVIGLSSQPETALLNADWISSQTVLHLLPFFQLESPAAFSSSTLLLLVKYLAKANPTQPLF
ncbi:hypothetical protein BKA64DRAFT_757986 [Cadophora sp. MPI-SDFR-AT-0126]|nr:hypothetical protein BKA64DRAFT_757986 [Leotiomycetes sp. MPI-SDFR-AT-0126]